MYDLNEFLKMAGSNCNIILVVGTQMEYTRVNDVKNNMLKVICWDVWGTRLVLFCEPNIKDENYRINLNCDKYEDDLK